jgi:hypothetical protein
MLTTASLAPVEIWRWQLEPDEEYPSHPHQAGVVETVNVTSGRMILVIDGTSTPSKPDRPPPSTATSRTPIAAQAPKPAT